MDNLDDLIEQLWKEIKTKVMIKDNIPEKTFTTLQVLKTIEELGEVSDMILRIWHTRKDKKMSEEDIKKNLGKEIADTVIALFTLAKSQNINIGKELEDKIKFEIERWKGEL
jgi:NTP pyrophosphatase (non-canonical NTP hydrolase)